MIDLYAKGKTDKQVARIVGVCEKTVNNWKGKHPRFLQSLKESKQIADDLVEASLFNRATGADGHRPDTTAQIFWLKNRQPKQWREKSAEKDININNFSDLSDEALDARIKKLLGEK